MSDASPKTRRLRKLFVDVNGIVIAGNVGKRVDVSLLDCLCYFGAIANAEVHFIERPQ